MARKSTKEDPITPPSVTPEVGKKIVIALSDKAKALLQSGVVAEIQLDTWTNQCQESLVRIFGSDSPYLHQFLRAGSYGIALMQDYPEQWWNNRRLKELKEKADTLDLFVGVLDSKIEEEKLFAPTASTVASHDAPQPRAASRDVFIVHGHDEATKTKVARFLERLEFRPIILHEQADQGMTIIEKLDKHGSSVAFAVVLLTPDDVGSVKGSTTSQPRARQNVILELGYFIGKLGRKNVCPLYSTGVELPSDFGSVGYTLLDAHEAWETKLAKELRAAGLAVDMNKL